MNILDQLDANITASLAWFQANTQGPIEFHPLTGRNWLELRAMASVDGAGNCAPWIHLQVPRREPMFEGWQWIIMIDNPEWDKDDPDSDQMVEHWVDMQDAVAGNHWGEAVPPVSN